MINSRDINDLDPIPRAICMRHISDCHARGIEIIVTSTYRDFDAQSALYAIGRTVDKGVRKPVTNALAGKSWHNYRCAWDVVPIIGGKAAWDDKNPVWREVVELGKLAGAEAGADWPRFRDLPHFQVVPVIAPGESQLTLTEARVRWDLHGTIFTT